MTRLLPRLSPQIAELLAEHLEDDDVSLDAAVGDVLEDLADDAERAELLELLAAEADAEPAAAFIARLVPHEPPPEHAAPLIDFFERARHEQIFEGHSWPPRHAKTVTIMRCMAWWIVLYPRDQCAYVTYSADKARAHSRIIRELVERAGVALMRGSRSLKRWQTVEGGGLVADGAMGGLTGYGFSGPVVWDDPYKGMADARSPRTRETIREVFAAVVFTRLEGAPVLVVHTRWDVEDLLGWLEAEKKWHVVNIEAIAPDPAHDPQAKPDPLGRAPGAALWPERYPAVSCEGPCGHAGHLDTIREQIGPYAWGALYCGRPPRRGGTVFGDPAYYDPATFVLDGHRLGIACDPAITAKTSADWSVLLAGGMLGQGGQSRLYLLDYDTAQVEAPELVERAIPMTERWPGAPFFAEAVGGFKYLPQTIRKVDQTVRQAEHERLLAAWSDAVAAGKADPRLPPPMPPPRVNVKPVYPTLDKLMRAQQAAAMWNAGRILVPHGAPWVPGFVARIRAFTGLPGGQDDDADALSHLTNGLFRRSNGQGMAGVMLIQAPHESYVGADA